MSPDQNKGISGVRVVFLLAVVCDAVLAQSGQSIAGLTPSFGGVGTVVVITGTDFGATPANGTVSFNSVAANPYAWSAGEIKAHVPARRQLPPERKTPGQRLAFIKGGDPSTRDLIDQIAGIMESSSHAVRGQISVIAKGSNLNER